VTRALATARLFVAVDPPPDVRERLTEWAGEAVRDMGLRKGISAPIRLLEQELLHLTLCFLGSRPLAEIDPIGEAIAACAAPVGEVRIGAPVWLPPRRPRALAVEVHDGGEDPATSLVALHDELLEALARTCGYVQEPRHGFRAHITLARLRDHRSVGLATERSLAPTPPLAFTPRALVLYRSWLSPAGASYEELVSHTLAPL
jgi:RNA 2',3'-cyclic 3'-phosphodiesterase